MLVHTDLGPKLFCVHRLTRPTSTLIIMSGLFFLTVLVPWLFHLPPLTHSPTLPPLLCLFFPKSVGPSRSDETRLNGTTTQERIESPYPDRPLWNPWCPGVTPMTRDRNIVLLEEDRDQVHSSLAQPQFRSVLDYHVTVHKCLVWMENARQSVSSLKFSDLSFVPLSPLWK